MSDLFGNQNVGFLMTRLILYLDEGIGIAASSIVLSELCAKSDMGTKIVVSMDNKLPYNFTWTETDCRTASIDEIRSTYANPIASAIMQFKYMQGKHIRSDQGMIQPEPISRPDKPK